jgi:hypothetical protein
MRPGTLLVALATGRAYQLYWPIAYFGFSSPFIDTQYTDKEAYLDMENPPGFGLGHCCDVQESEDKRAQHLLALVRAARAWFCSVLGACAAAAKRRFHTSRCPRRSKSAVLSGTGRE